MVYVVLIYSAIYFRHDWPSASYTFLEPILNASHFEKGMAKTGGKYGTLLHPRLQSFLVFIMTLSCNDIIVDVVYHFYFSFLYQRNLI